jgi:hypothetical protein
MKVRRWTTRVGVALLALSGVVAVGSPSVAAVPDRAAFVLFTGGAVTEAMPAGTTVIPIGVGRWQVRFPGAGIVGGVVHVTAVHDALSDPPGRWCQAEAWGAAGIDELVRVACFAPGGVLDSRPGFSLLFSRSSGVIAAAGHYGYIDSTAGGAIISQYNSAGAANGVIHAGVGAYSISFPALGTPGTHDGSMQVTAVNAGVGARCKVAGWGSSPNGQFARLFCHNAAGVAFDTRFTVSYQFRRTLFGPAFPPNRFGYLWNVPPLGPVPTNFNSSGVLNTLAGGPPYSVTYPNLGTPLGNVQVTAHGGGANYCNLHSPWVSGGGHLFVRINCFTNAGTMVPSGFFASYSSRF